MRFIIKWTKNKIQTQIKEISDLLVIESLILFFQLFSKNFIVLLKKMRLKKKTEINFVQKFIITRNYKYQVKI